MSLSKILEEIKRLKPLAEEDTETGNLQTMSVRRGRKKRAQEELKILRGEYRKDLLSSAVFILVAGDKRDEFVTEATTNLKCFTADTDAFYKDLAGRVAPALYAGKSSVSNLFDVLGRHLEDKARELDVIGYPQLIFTQKYRQTITNKEEFTALVRQAVNDQIGGEMVGLETVERLTDSLISSGWSGVTTPIVLSVESEKLAVELAPALRRLTKKVFVVGAGKTSKTFKGPSIRSVKDASPESVSEVLVSIGKVVQ